MSLGPFSSSATRKKGFRVTAYVSEVKEPAPFPTTAALLHYLYRDLTRLSDVASADLVLHPFAPANSQPLVGIAAAQAHEEALVKATRATLVMDVESVTANDNFGVVMGTLRAKKDGLKDLAMPFCGVWRFEGGLAVEHWENGVGNPDEVAEWLNA
ncbi:hypothetical protein F5Y15DRAFT_410974 [Xylariaceae sp. FL0016]|nr:hypothetical protein F5Y15DRAFT_410974 [Xylariaceae sp. FL0016]